MSRAIIYQLGKVAALAIALVGAFIGYRWAAENAVTGNCELLARSITCGTWIDHVFYRVGGLARMIGAVVGGLPGMFLYLVFKFFGPKPERHWSLKEPVADYDAYLAEKLAREAKDSE
jgi:hypothetical protein